MYITPPGPILKARLLRKICEYRETRLRTALEEIFPTPPCSGLVRFFAGEYLGFENRYGGSGTLVTYGNQPFNRRLP